MKLVGRGQVAEVEQYFSSEDSKIKASQKIAKDFIVISHFQRGDTESKLGPNPDSAANGRIVVSSVCSGSYHHPTLGPAPIIGPP